MPSVLSGSITASTTGSSVGGAGVTGSMTGGGSFGGSIASTASASRTAAPTTIASAATGSGGVDIRAERSTYEAASAWSVADMRGPVDARRRDRWRPAMTTAAMMTVLAMMAASKRGSRMS